MNKSSIEWCDYTWNPVVGCLHGCSYCYARRHAERGLGEYGEHPKGERFQPRILSERLDQPAKVKKPSRVFVCSMADLFGEWVPDEWILRVWTAMGQAPQHTYQLLTKNPSRLRGFSFGENVWAGTTVTDQDALCKSLYWLADVKTGVRFISFEPLLGPVELPNYTPLDWIIVGAMTGQLAKKNPTDPAWAERLIKWAYVHDVPCFLKENLGWPLELCEYPEGTR